MIYRSENRIDRGPTKRAILVALLMLIPLMLVAPSAQAGETYQVPSSIDSTCTTDVTADIQAFFDSVPNGSLTAAAVDYSVIEFPAGACYRIEGTLTLAGRTAIRVDGNGAYLWSGRLLPRRWGTGKTPLIW